MLILHQKNMQTENVLLNSFLSKLSEIEDNRRGEGQRHKQEFVLYFGQDKKPKIKRSEN